VLFFKAIFFLPQYLTTVFPFFIVVLFGFTCLLSSPLEPHESFSLMYPQGLAWYLPSVVTQQLFNEWMNVICCKRPKMF
jgi:hypothetical protein